MMWSIFRRLRYEIDGLALLEETVRKKMLYVNLVIRFLSEWLTLAALVNR